MQTSRGWLANASSRDVTTFRCPAAQTVFWRAELTLGSHDRFLLRWASDHSTQNPGSSKLVEVRSMKPTLFLRIAAVLTFIHSVLHTIGGVFSNPDPGISATTWAAMK